MRSRIFLYIFLFFMLACKGEITVKNLPSPSNGTEVPEPKEEDKGPPEYVDFLFSKMLSDEDVKINDSSGNEWANGGVSIDDEDGSIYLGVYATSGLSYASTNYGGSDMGVLKMSPEGKVLWNVQFTQDHPLINDSSGNEKIYDVIIDGDFIYALGTSTGDFVEMNAGGNDTILIKMKKDSSIVWVKHIGTSTLNNYATIPGNFVGVDGSSGEVGSKLLIVNGKLYVYGQVNGGRNLGEASGGASDIMFFVLDTDGNLEKIKQWGSDTLNQYTVATGDATDGSGDVYPTDFISSGGKLYVVGHIKVGFLEAVSGIYDPYIVKVDPSTLNPIKIVQFSTSVINSYRTSNGMPPLGSSPRFEFDEISTYDGKIYIGGRTGGTLTDTFGGGSFDKIVAKIDAVSLETDWIKQFGSSFIGDTGGIEYSGGTVVTPSGRLFALVATQSNFVEANGGGYDCAVLEIDKINGSVLNSIQFGATTMNGGSNNHEWCYSMSNDRYGNLYMNIGTQSRWDAASPVGGESILLIKLDEELNFNIGVP